MRAEPRRLLPKFLLLYGAMYAAFGAASPFLPSFISDRGLPAELLGGAIAAGTVVRLVTAPLAGRLADLLQRLRIVLSVSAALGAFVTFCYVSAHGAAFLFALGLFHAAALAPTATLADALALGSARRGLEYGWVRGAGSAAFVAGTLLSGQAVGAFGQEVIIVLQGALLGAAALAALGVPELGHRDDVPAARAPMRGVLLLLEQPRFRDLVLVAALVLGSHAMHDAFAVLRWREADIGPAAASLLWSESVAAEVLVFFVLGPAVLARVGPAGAMAIAAAAGLVRWTVTALSSDVVAFTLVQPLHGLTFALFHLAAVRLLARIVPHGLEGTALALYGAVGVGAASALFTLASGELWAKLGAIGFLAMAALCALALPLTARLRARDE